MSVLDKYPLMLIHNDNSEELYSNALILAKKAADVLKKKYSASKVVLFGSLLDENSFGTTSDIDLAVLGIPDNKFYDAVGTIIQVVTPFEVDLVDISDCRESIKKSIENEGVEL